MSGQIIAAIIAFAAGVIVASLNGWYNQRLENRKHVAQQASAAFVDGAKALANRNQAIAALETMNDPSISERMTWQRWLSEANAEYAAAKARVAAYGSKQVGHFLATAESRGGFDKGQDETVQELVAKTLLALRSDIGFPRNDISERDIIILLFGYPPGQRPLEAI